MKRRKFIKYTLPTIALPSFLGGFNFRALAGGPILEALQRGACDPDRILVLIQLNGGNDGLNTVLPLDQYSNLALARPNILISESKALKLAYNPATGLHPAMSAIQNLNNEGRGKILQAVSYPAPNFSHFRATDIWLTGSDSNKFETTGWLGRYLEKENPGYPEGYPNAANPDPLAIQIGSVLSPALQGNVVNMGMSITDPSSFYNLITGSADPTPNTPYGHELTYIRLVAQQTQQYAASVKNAAASGSNLSTLYPATGNSLSDQLKIVAKLISGGLKTKVYMVSLGGFDTHSNQVQSGTGNETGSHATLLGRLNDAINAFTDDLQKMGKGDKVLTMTFSEFGRRIRSNGSTGTDHGEAAPLFMFGPNLIPGMLGNNPTIKSSHAVGDNVPMQIDFRAIYTTILKDWFCVEGSELVDIMLKTFNTLPIFNTSTATEETQPGLEDELLAPNYPNPFADNTKIRFKSQGEKVYLVIHDSLGREISVLANQYYPTGTHEIDFVTSDLSTGVYYCTMISGNYQKVIPMLKAR
jgi:uncharacterized protein (DUF1501 family)